MSRRTRKIKANKIYDKELDKKTLAIAEIGINLAIGITKLLSEPNSATSLQIMVMLEMSKEQQRLVISQPLSITKPNKYGKFKDYMMGGIVVRAL